jgi:L-lactate utilization protein LutB
MHGPKEVHVILLDNGRQNLAGQGYGELLACIDCGACFESMSILSRQNGWAETPLTPKGIALGIIQGVLAKSAEVQGPAEFDCPVGIDSKGFRSILNRIEPAG